MERQKTVYITGHRHPDTDSIASAIAYALLQRRKGINAVPCRLGPINTETRWLLERFGFEEPMLFEDARATIKEIDMDPPLTITPETTIYETLQLMKQNNKQSYGVVNQKGQLLGMVTRSDLSRVGLGDTAAAIQLLKDTPLDYIAKTIRGFFAYRDEEYHFNGKVSIIAMTETGLNDYDIRDRLVMLGNDTEAQKAAIRKGAGILVVVWTKEIAPEVIELAKAHHCPIIISGHGTMNTSRYLYFAPPVRLIMLKSLVSFNMDEFVEDVGKKMLKSRYRSYPVIDNNNYLRGYLSRYHILDYRNKQVILVDHNEYAQSVKGVEKADLLEIIDHHRICDIATSRPISFRNEIIGSTASIITSIYMENQMDIPKNVAGLLLGAILSDTLKFRSPTTTPKDIGLAKTLAHIADLDIDAFASEMFRVSSNISQKSVQELITQDVKTFQIDSHKVMIAQIIISAVDEVHSIEDELQQEMNSFAIDKELDLFVAAFTSILENGSIFYASGPLSEIVTEAFPNHHGAHSFQEDILSRKNQIVPLLSRAIINSAG
ncbi:MAG: putative manganese-dependent inorganic diphosphatase [Merdibacter sp.]|nr:putative manganese-dependent inorganic diphosphatase [Merdibacter sp.]HIY90821.1 putative manganese-dependent inorganic diphosphatase [Candidatus Merdibacter merdipullorum]